MGSTWITDRSGRQPLPVLSERMGLGANRCKLRQISPHLLDAIVAVEDQRFYQHGGVDWPKRGIGGVAGSAGDAVSPGGASTLTMQLEHLRKPAPPIADHQAEAGNPGRSNRTASQQAADRCRVSQSRAIRRKPDRRGRRPVGDTLVSHVGI